MAGPSPHSPPEAGCWVVCVRAFFPGRSPGSGGWRTTWTLHQPRAAQSAEHLVSSPPRRVTTAMSRCSQGKALGVAGAVTSREPSWEGPSSSVLGVGAGQALQFRLPAFWSNSSSAANSQAEQAPLRTFSLRRLHRAPCPCILSLVLSIAPWVPSVRGVGTLVEVWEVTRKAV